MSKKLSREEAEEYTSNLGHVAVGNYGLMDFAINTLRVPEALGLTSDEWVQQRLGGYIRWTIDQRREAVRELLAEGRKGTEIAQVLGISPNTVQRDKDVLKAEKPAREAISPAPTSKKPAREGFAPEQRDEQIRRLIEESKTNAEIVVLFKAGLSIGRKHFAPLDVGTSTISKLRTKMKKEKAEAALRAEQAKEDVTDFPTEADQKAVEAELDEHTDEMKRGFVTMFDLTPINGLEDAAKTLRQMIEIEAKFSDYKKALMLWAQIGEDLWVYGAKAGIDVSEIARTIDKVRGGSA